MNQKFAYSISEILELVPLGRTSLYAEIARGNLIAKKIGRRTVILDSDLRLFLNTLPSVVTRDP